MLRQTLALLLIGTLIGVGVCQHWSCYCNNSSASSAPLQFTIPESPISSADQASQRTIAYLGNRLYSSLGDSTSEILHGISAFSKYQECPGLISQEQFTSLIEQLSKNDSNSLPRFALTRHGARFLDTQHYKKIDGEAHPFQGLAVLCGVGVHLNAEFSINTGELISLRELANDCEAMFGLDGEFEWPVIALIHMYPLRRCITNRFGREFTLDEISDHLFNRIPGTGSCSGCHVIEALVLLELAAKAGNQYISINNKQKIASYLDSLQSFLCSIQSDDGGIPKQWGALWVMSEYYCTWSSRWKIKKDWGLKALNEFRKTERTGDLLTTSHHINWIFHRGSIEKSTLNFFEEANVFVFQNVLNHLQSDDLQTTVRKNLCPICHGIETLLLMNCSRKKQNNFLSMDCEL